MRKDRSVSLPDDHWARLAEMAAADDRSVSWHIRRAVADYLASERAVHAAPETLRPTGIVPPNQGSAAPDDPPSALVPDIPGPDTRTTGEPVLPGLRVETRDPDDVEAAGLREAFPHLKEPKIVDPNRRKR